MLWKVFRTPRRLRRPECSIELDEHIAQAQTHLHLSKSFRFPGGDAAGTGLLSGLDAPYSERALIPGEIHRRGGAETIVIPNLDGVARASLRTRCATELPLHTKKSVRSSLRRDKFPLQSELKWTKAQDRTS